MAIKLSTFDVNDILKWKNIENKPSSLGLAYSTSEPIPPLGTANPNDKPNIIKLSKQEFKPTKQEQEIINYHTDTVKQGKQLINKDGSVTTVYSTGIKTPDGKFVSVPGYNRETGKIMSEEEAYNYWQKDIEAGKFPIYDTGEELNKRSQELHKLIEAPDITPDLNLIPKTSMKTQDTTQDSLINTHLDRLGFNTDDAKNRLDILANTISEIESNNNPKAVNIPQKDKEQTSAKGMFQYVDGSINPAINRVEKYTGEVEWLKDLKEGKIDIRDLTPEQQTTLFFGDILEKTIGGKSGYGDKLFKQLLDPNSTPEQIKDAIRKLYYEGHHTAPDEATKKRVENILNKLEL